MTLKPVQPGDVVSADAWNAILAMMAGGVRAGAGLDATLTGSGVALSLSERRDRTIAWALITAVQGQDGDAADAITYDSVQVGQPQAVLLGATPAYGRVYASGVATRPARVGDLCLHVRAADAQGAVTASLWILSEQYHGRRCSSTPPPPPPPPPSKQSGPSAEIIADPLPVVSPGLFARVIDTLRAALGPTSPPAARPAPQTPNAATPAPEAARASQEPAMPRPVGQTSPARPLAATHLINLAIAAARVRVPVPPGVGVRVTAAVSGGSWSVGNKLKVRLDGPGGSTDFATAREIAGPGGSVAVGPDELRGVAHVVIEQSGTPDSAGTYALVTLTADYDAAVSIQSGQPAAGAAPAPVSESVVTPDP